MQNQRLIDLACERAWSMLGRRPRAELRSAFQDSSVLARCTPVGGNILFLVPAQWAGDLVAQHEDAPAQAVVTAPWEPGAVFTSLVVSGWLSAPPVRRDSRLVEVFATQNPTFDLLGLGTEVTLLSLEPAECHIGDACGCVQLDADETRLLLSSPRK